MRIWKEVLTVMALSRMDKDKVCVTGINEKGLWVRAIQFYMKDLEERGQKIFRPLGQTEIFCCEEKIISGRPEDRFIFVDETKKPKYIRELSGDDQKKILEDHLDESVYSIFSKGRTLGLIKPIVDLVEFCWNPYHEEYEARFVFRDNSGKKYDFLCTDLNWRNYWIHFVNHDPEQLTCELLKMQWTLNDQDTYFVIGLTEPFPEMPGPFDSRWPLVLGVHSLTIPDYIRDYNT